MVGTLWDTLHIGGILGGHNAIVNGRVKYPTDTLFLYLLIVNVIGVILSISFFFLMIF